MGKMTAVFLASVMTVGLLAGCGAKTAATGPAKGTPVQLVMDWPDMYGVPADWPAVQAAVSKITRQKIDATVKINLVDMGSWAQHVNVVAAGGSDVDIMYTGTRPVPLFAELASKGALLPLDKLLGEDGQGIKKAVAPAFLKCGCLNGIQYAIPILSNYATQNAIVMRKDLVEKYHIDVKKIKSPADLSAVFQTIKDNNPHMIPFAANSIGTVPANLTWYDDLGDGLGVLPNYDNNLKVVDVFETKQYAQTVDMAREWYLKGYINPDAATFQGNPLDLIKAGRAFSFMWSNSPGMLPTIDKTAGMPMVMVPLAQPVVTTTDVAAGMYSILTSSKHPQRAMELINLLCTNKEIVNLLNRGIEGKDYTKVSDGVIALPPDHGSTYNLVPMIGDNFLTYLYNTDNPKLWQEQEKFTNNALKSKALGFVFNPSSVATQYAAVENVLQQYKPGLENGSMDPRTTLPQFIAKLKAAGIDKIIAAKQKQLDKWAQSTP